MAFGLFITNKMARARPGPAAFELHEYVSLLGLGFALFHGLILMGDQFIHYNLAQVLLPFGSYGFKPFWVGLGQLSFYLSVVLVASFYVRQADRQPDLANTPLCQFRRFFVCDGARPDERHGHCLDLDAGYLLAERSQPGVLNRL